MYEGLSSTHFSGEELSGALTIEAISKGKTIKELGVSPERMWPQTFRLPMAITICLSV